MIIPIPPGKKFMRSVDTVGKLWQEFFIRLCAAEYGEEKITKHCLLLNFFLKSLLREESADEQWNTV